MNLTEALIGRIEGRLAFRFILQPFVAAILAVRAGWRDARFGRSPFLYTIVSDPNQRVFLLQQGWKDVSKVFILAVVMDLIYQWMEFTWLYPLRACAIGGILAVVPYLILRGIVCRTSRFLGSRPFNKKAIDR